MKNQMNQTKNRPARAIRRSREDALFDALNVLLFALILLIVLYPLYFLLIASFSAPSAVLNGEVTLLIRDMQLDGYSHIFSSVKIWRGYLNSVLYTILGTSLNVLLTMMAAYPLSRTDFRMRRPIMLMMVFTMYFSGGLIPTYMVADALGLAGHWPVLIVLGAVSVWNIIIARTFIQNSLPGELLDAARIDGCSDYRYLFAIVVPLSKALIAVLCLYYGMGHWNSYFAPMIYLKERNEFPLQMILREILVIASVDTEMMGDIPGIEKQLQLAESIKYGLIIVASVPMLIIYPFLQKYFVKGVMIGSVKG